MALNTKNQTTVIQDIVAGIQSATATFQDLTVGSILRAVSESVSGVVMFLQALIVQLLSTTRASTATSTDLDSWVGDYGVTRLAATKATGLVTFSRFTATNQAVVPVGAQVQSTDGTQTFTVTLNTANAAYNATLGGYVAAATASSVTVPVQAATAGAGGNVGVGALTVIIQPISFIDTASNAASFVNGADAESDAALRLRFIAYVASLSKATKGAIAYAITSIQPGMSYAIGENLLYNGTAQMGNFYVVVDDGTGVPSSNLLTLVGTAIDAVRPISSTFSVNAPVVVTANVAMTITTSAGYIHSAVVTLVTNAITNYINSLTLGQTLTFTRLSQVAYDASPGVTNVSGATLNGAALDITTTAAQVIKAGTVVVS